MRRGRQARRRVGRESLGISAVMILQVLRRAVRRRLLPAFFAVFYPPGEPRGDAPKEASPRVIRCLLLQEAGELVVGLLGSVGGVILPQGNGLDQGREHVAVDLGEVALAGEVELGD